MDGNEVIEKEGRGVRLKGRAQAGRFQREGECRYRYKYWAVRASTKALALALGIAPPREIHYLRRIHASGRGVLVKIRQ
jgi:hypothetical protein